MKEFNSQICTSREQSERLLSLGLKKETADMYWVNHLDLWMPVMLLYEDRPLDNNDIPAWSLHRLIEMVAHTQYPYYVISKELPIYDALCERIEWLIKEGYFKKEYLVNQAEIEEHCKGVLEYLDYIRGEEE